MSPWALDLSWDIQELSIDEFPRYRRVCPGVRPGGLLVVEDGFDGTGRGL
jgi:hypothetical protein